MQNMISKASVIVCVSLFCAAGFAWAQEYVQLPAAIHMASDISDGKLTLGQIAARAGENGISVLIPTDRDSMVWEYGMPGLRNIVKKRVSDRSVFSYGIDRYLQRLAALQKESPGMIIIPGIESAPYYYWQGSFFADDLVIKDWHKHMLVIGLSKPSDLEYLPVLGNPKGLCQPMGLKNIFLAWPLVLAAFGIWCLRRRVYSYADSSGKKLGPFSRGWRITGIFSLFIAGLMFINNYPFCYQKFDQYHGSRGVMPYQNLIDYANGRGGLTFWAHPEVSNIDKTGPVGIETDEHTEYLLKTKGYTGFAVFYEGFKKVGIIGGIWDQVLTEYCQGSRNSPIWAIGALAFDKTGDLAMLMNDVRTVLLCGRSDGAAALDALKKGRMYCSRGRYSSSFVLDKFTVSDGAGIDKTMGEEILLRKDPVIGIQGHFLRGQDKMFTIQLIRNGKLLRVFEAQTPFDISYTDTASSISQKTYYRLQITTGDTTVITNPIFVQR
ncbi:MAG: hypothetical protein WC547_05430 [Candidatus Omnitrophota bacterium]